MKMKLKAFMKNATQKTIGSEIIKTAKNKEFIETKIRNSQRRMITNILKRLPLEESMQLCQFLRLEDLIERRVTGKVSEHEMKQIVSDKLVGIITEVETDARYVMGHLGYASAMFAISAIDLNRLKKVMIKRLPLFNEITGDKTKAKEIEAVFEEIFDRFRPEIRKELREQGRLYLQLFYRGRKLSTLESFQKKLIAKTQPNETTKEALNKLETAVEGKQEAKILATAGAGSTVVNNGTMQKLREIAEEQEEFTDPVKRNSGQGLPTSKELEEKSKNIK